MTKSNSVASAQARQLALEAERFAEKCDWRSANQLFCKALTLDPLPSICIAYGVCLAKQERYFEAISCFTTVLDCSDRSAIGIVCHNLAAIYREVGDFDLARRFQWRATLMQDDSGAEDLVGMANDALVNQHNEVAASLVMTAREMMGQETDECSDGDLVATTGLIKAAMNSTEDGLITVFAGYRRHQANFDFRGMGNDLLNMAVLFGQLDRRRAERACLIRAIRCFELAAAPYSRQKAQQRLAQFDRVQTIRSFDARRN